MRLRSVRLRAFGPFRDETLELAPGMNVIGGDNEAGKSTWHAGIYAALCGMRRRAGRPKKDGEFVHRHRPWEGDTWAVEARLELNDGRDIELSHDLDGRVACRAVDVGLGRRDVSDEIMFEGSPDASRWLGLDRRTFLATACVGQAEVLAVRECADGLQEHLQRAAATAGADETAARALSLLEEFRKERVGTAYANSTRPLRRAMNALAAAETDLVRAQADHAGYLGQLEEAERLAEAAAQERQRLNVLTAASAGVQAAAVEEALARARELQASLDAQPIDADALRAAASRVGAAIAAWKGSAAPQPLDGPSAAELEAQLATLPPAPTGDLVVAAAVESADAAWRGARQALTANAAAEPSAAGPLPTILSASQLRDLARDLRTPVPDVDATLAGRQTELQARLESVSERRVSRPLVALAVLVALAGVGAALFTTPALAIGGLSVGAALAAIAWRRGSGPSRAALLDELRAVEGRLGTAQLERRSALATVAHAQEVAAGHRLPATAGELTALAATVEQAATATQTRQIWESTNEKLALASGEAEGRLRAALIGRGVLEVTDLVAAVDAYREGCRLRGEVARQAARRPDLERELRARRSAEGAAAAAAIRHAQATDGLIECARELDLAVADSDEALRMLEAWERANREEMEQGDRQGEQRGELSSLLGGRSLDDLERDAQAARARARAAARELPAGEVERAALEPDLPSRLNEARQQAENAGEAAASARGAVTSLSAGRQSVSACEEALAGARGELERVRSLDATLETTLAFLERAQERVHRDVAPVLERTLRAWLPRITAGRYTDAAVDAETLQVQVKGPDGEFREASRLSQGTQEQIYLLLRMALVAHLTKPGETCPLILDDVTVQTDSPRTVAILELLHEISVERQVIVFSQEEDVRDWARQNLGERDRMELLGKTAVATT